MSEPSPAHGGEAPGKTAEIVDAFLAAIEAGVPQEDAGRQAAEANIDMLTATIAGQILAKTDAAVADLRAKQARITQRWGTALDACYMVTKGAAELGALAAHPRPQATFDTVSKALVLLQARACQTSFEVRAALRRVPRRGVRTLPDAARAGRHRRPDQPVRPPARARRPR